jgi:hypothetical protein
MSVQKGETYVDCMDVRDFLPSASPNHYLLGPTSQGGLEMRKAGVLVWSRPDNNGEDFGRGLYHDTLL